MLFLTGCTNSKIEGALVENGVGLLCSPDNSYHLRAGKFAAVAFDNGTFGLWQMEQGLSFSLQGQLPQVALWTNWLDRMTDHVAPESVLFCAVPDVVGDAARTLELFRLYGDRPRRFGFKNALVAQNGLENMLEEIDWDAVDVVFLGGSTEWKLGAGAAAVVREAKSRGKWVHMGRVNSGRRMEYAASIGVDSCDGTYLAFGPEKNLPRLLAMVEKCNQSQLELEEVLA